jgi:HPt (histidine-containing phosphotransfer) domain-containing protein
MRQAKTGFTAEGKRTRVGIVADHGTTPGVTSPMNASPAVNVDQLINLCGDDPDGSFMREMVDSCASRGPALIGKLRDAASRADLDALQNAAHQFRGMAANLGAHQVATMNGELENLARQPGGGQHDFGPMIAAIEASYTESLAILRAHCERVGRR